MKVKRIVGSVVLEERELAREFGETWGAYAGATSRWFPRLGRAPARPLEPPQSGAATVCGAHLSRADGEEAVQAAESNLPKSLRGGFES